MPKVFQSAVLPLACLALSLAPLPEASASSFAVERQHVTERARAQGEGPGGGGLQWGRLVVRKSAFREMVRGAQPQSCQIDTPPEPLATPSPVLDSAENLQLTVNFVVGTDGRVYSALILEGVKDEQARSVLDAIRHWRFRPAVCNGAPTEAEAKVEFSTPPNRF